MTAFTADIREYFKRIGAKGGSVKSEAKAKAARENGQKPKRKKAKRPKERA